MPVVTAPFGAYSAFQLANANGMILTLSDLGATVLGLIVPDRAGAPVDIALGYADPESYPRSTAYLGAVVGRIANRIAGARFSIGGKTILLDANDGPNSLHGGSSSYSVRRWRAAGSGGSVRFTLASPEGDQGMPGSADIAVTYTLTDSNELRIHYHAAADRDTVFNLTNHTYFNLAGHANGDILDHVLRLRCDRFTPTDAQSIPSGDIVPVAETPMDFHVPKAIGADIDADDRYLRQAGGYDHNYVLTQPGLEVPFAEVSCARSGIEMRAYTDLPGVQFYSGNYLNDAGGKGGAFYKKRAGFCLETQFFPDAPNHPNFPSALFRKGEAFDFTTVYAFSAR